MPENRQKLIGLIFRIPEITPGMKTRPKIAIQSLFHTNAVCSNVISLPKIAVTPKRSTAICNCRYAFCLVFGDADTFGNNSLKIRRQK